MSEILILCALLAGTFQHTPRSERAERWLRRIIRSFDWTLAQAADMQGLDASQFNRQLKAYLGQTPSYYRLLELDVAFQRERIKLEAAAHGLTVLDSDDVRDLLLEYVVSQAKHMAHARIAPRTLAREESA